LAKKKKTRGCAKKSVKGKRQKKGGKKKKRCTQKKKRQKKNIPKLPAVSKTTAGKEHQKTTPTQGGTGEKKSQGGCGWEKKGKKEQGTPLTKGSPRAAGRGGVFFFGEPRGTRKKNPGGTRWGGPKGRNQGKRKDTPGVFSKKKRNAEGEKSEAKGKKEKTYTKGGNTATVPPPPRPTQILVGGPPQQ